MSSSTIYKWEKDISSPNIEFWDKLSEILEVPFDELIYYAKNDSKLVLDDVQNENCDIAVSVSTSNDENIIIENKKSEDESTSEKFQAEHLKRGECYIRNICIILVVLTVIASGVSIWSIHRNNMTLNIVDEYFVEASGDNDKDTYYVIIEYKGEFNKEIAAEFATNCRDDYEKKFEFAERIGFIFVEDYVGKGANEEVTYQKWLMPIS